MLEKQNLVIISANQKENTHHENLIANADLICDLLELVGFDARVIPTTGKFDGYIEQSYAVVMPPEGSGDPTFDRIQNGLIELGCKYNQYCLLLVFNEYDPEISMIFPLTRSYREGGEIDTVAYPWIQITPEEVEDVQAWTEVKGRYFYADLDNEIMRIPPTEEAKVTLEQM